MARRLALDTVVSRLKSLDWHRLGIRHVVLFGSLARHGEGRDVDLLVASCREPMGFNDYIRMLDAVAEVLDVDWSQVDILEAGKAPCPVILDAWRNGVRIYSVDPRELRCWLLSRVKVCIDYQLWAKRLRIVEKASRAARRRWGRVGGTL